jgi:urease accessory protein UreE
VNPRKLKPGDRLLWSDDMLLWSNRKEEVVVSVNKEKFRTVDKDCTIVLCDLAAV